MFSSEAAKSRRLLGLINPEPATTEFTLPPTIFVSSPRSACLRMTALVSGASVILLGLVATVDLGWRGSGLYRREGFDDRVLVGSSSGHQPGVAGF